MKKFVFFMVLTALLAGCNGRKDRADGRFVRESVERILTREKVGDKCYLRMETKEGNITSLTYRYDD